MRAVRFHGYGEPNDVLHLEEAPIPEPGPGQVRIRVHACGLNPADWALCRGLFAGSLPRGVGLDVSGTVDAVGEGVTKVKVGDPVFGAADFQGASAGLADFALSTAFERVPAGLDLDAAATLPMVVETAYRYIDTLGVAAGKSVLVHGAGTMIGFGAVQMCLHRGARVLATAGTTYADRLRAFGAKVTAYGEGMVGRVRELAGGTPDLVFDATGAADVLPALIEIAGGDRTRVITVNFVAAKEHGVLGAIVEGAPMPRLRHDAFPEHAALAAAGKFTVPIARTFALADWKEAVALSQGGQARGKILVRP